MISVERAAVLLQWDYHLRDLFIALAVHCTFERITHGLVIDLEAAEAYIRRRLQEGKLSLRTVVKLRRLMDLAWEWLIREVEPPPCTCQKPEIDPDAIPF